MTSTTRGTWNWLALTKAAVGIVASTPFIEAPFGGVRGGTTGLDPAGLNGRGARQKRRSRVVGGLWVQVCYALIDIFCVTIDVGLAFLLRYPVSDLRHPFASGRLAIVTQQPVMHYGGFLLLYTALILLFCQFQDLYRTPRTRSALDESFAVLKAISFASLLITAFIYLSGVKVVSRFVVVTSFFFNIITLIAWRYAKRKLVIHRVERGIGTRNAVIVGAGRVGQALAHQLDENKLLGYQFKGFLDGNHFGEPRLLGQIEDLPRVARAEFIDEVFITIPSERELVKRIAMEAQHYGLDVTVVPDMYDGLGWNAPIRHLGDFPVMDLHWQSLPTMGLFVKRVFDIVSAAAGLTLCLPILVVIGFWIKFDSKGPVLYRSRRVGKKGYIFTCYKLRTMVMNADDLKDSLRHRNERRGPFFKITDDPRITRLGGVLRKFSLDELPQLWNVLKGDMSLVGPRPHPLDDYKQYDIEHLRRLDVKPGMTGLWQVTSRQDPSFERNMHLDLEYIEKWNFWLDLQILFKTLPIVVQGDGQ